jgi:hypothetical protein
MHEVSSYTHGPYSPVVGSILPVVVTVLLFARGLTQRRAPNAAPLWYKLSLAGCLVLAVGNYFAFGEFRYSSYMNEWDVTHYYTGTKYATELGYFHQYEAIWLADQETGLRSTASEVRSLRTYEMVPTARLAARADEIRGRFSPERWREFREDIAWLKMQLPAARWTLLTEDHGHNAPPTWTAAVGIVTNALSIRSDVARWMMLLIDPALLLLALAALTWAYGFEATVLTAVLLGTHYFFCWGHLKGTLVRTDFVTFALFAICLFRKDRPVAAGMCAAIAACSRAFPVFFLVGPLVVLLSRLARERRLDPVLARFFLACGATAAAATVCAILRFHGVGIFSDWISKMALHATSHADWTVGFRTIFNTVNESYFQEGSGMAVARWIDVRLAREEVIMLWVTRILVLLPAIYFMRFMTAASAYGFAYVVMFFAVAPVHYYAMVLCLPLLYFVAEPAGWSRTLGIAWLLITGSAGYLLYYGWRPLGSFWLFKGYGQTFATTLYSTCFITLTTLHMVAHAARSARAGHRPRTKSDIGRTYGASVSGFSAGTISDCKRP